MEKEKMRVSAVKIIKIILGAALFAMGIQWFYHPATLLSGGITGVALILNYLNPHLRVGILIIAFNVPLFLIALRHYGWRFIAGSLLGMLSSSLIIDLLGSFRFEFTTEPILAALYGGVLTGFGLGIVYSTGATTGGTDIIAKFIRERYPYLNFGTLILTLDAGIIATYAAIFRKFDNAMYTVVGIFVASKMIDLVLYGASQSKLCLIISEHSDEIKDAIVEKLHRGVTVLYGKGAYSGLDKQVLLCAVKHQQIVGIRAVIRGIDENAFVIVTDARDVFGQNFGNIGITN
ncbi:MAG: YitT family protein [Oscillospiraceae bacterium]